MPSLCPDAPDYVECCVAPYFDGGSGSCYEVSDEIYQRGGGHFVRFVSFNPKCSWRGMVLFKILLIYVLRIISDFCPGPSDYQCCIGHGSA